MNHVEQGGEDYQKLVPVWKATKFQSGTRDKFSKQEWTEMHPAP